jgi:hypothetical protein
MKLLKSKKMLVLIGLIIVGVLAVTGVAIAWFTTSASLGGNSVSTATMRIQVNGSDNNAFAVSGLAPRVAPGLGAWNTEDPSAESTYPSKFFFVYNNGDMPEMFYAWLALNDPAGISDKVMLRIWLDPSDYPGGPQPSYWKTPDTYLVYQGPLNAIASAAGGQTYLRTITPANVKEELPVGTYATYKVVFWLDGSAGNTYMGQTLWATLNIQAGQPDAWPF